MLVALAGGTNPKEFFASFPTTKANSVCNTVWKSGTIAYRCLVCEVDPTSAVCADCFINGEHSGHEYRIIIAGGCCDCGDAMSWRSSGFCARHGVPLGSDGKPEYQPRLPADLLAQLSAIVDVVVTRLLRDTLLALEYEKAANAAPPGSQSQATLAPESESLLRAAQQGDVKILKEALALGASPDVKDGSEFETTALHWASQCGHFEAVGELLAAGASVDSTNVYLQTALQCSVFEGHIKVCSVDARQPVSKLYHTRTAA